MANRLDTATRPEGQKKRPVQTAAIWSPKVLALDGKYLLCDQNQNQIARPGSGVLDGFLDLANAEPQEILKFAQKWGALCIRSKPVKGLLRFLEPITAWTDLATRFRALHRIGAE